jgi:hypothetical protein
MVADPNDVERARVKRYFLDENVDGAPGGGPG